MVLFPEYPVMIIDDEESALESFSAALMLGGINNLIKCRDSREVLTILSKQEIECILLDLNMPHMDGQELLPKIKESFPDIPVIIITGIDEVTTAVDCIKNGAADYLVKPVEKNKLLSHIKRELTLNEFKRKFSNLTLRLFSGKLEHPETFSDIITRNEAMHSIFQYVEVIASSPEPVLISGETGVGKELIARALHKLSNRKGQFVAFNLAGVDDTVFSDTLFGHEKGAYTDAYRHRIGMISKAAGGTLFLDEIGDLSIPSQIKLLRLLQEHEYFPLGSDVPKYSDARVIVATNQDVNRLQESGKFRKDLYYRLHVHHVHILPLRSRFEDLPLLVEHFLDEAADKLNKKKPTPPKELFTLLQTYQFPGNIRELRAMIFNAVSVHKSKMLSLETFIETIRAEETALRAGPDSPDETAGKSDTAVSFSSILPKLKEMEGILIEESMKRASGNQAIAARMLGISRQALNSRLKYSLKKE